MESAIGSYRAVVGRSSYYEKFSFVRHGRFDVDMLVSLLSRLARQLLKQWLNDGEGQQHDAFLT